ncbi:butyrophilin subfamily 1 member A1 [Grus japonensis]|uniref:Butyrophilin subfamily 1 member A1 n=1 Tax=Grus japonensis TaxID=30415 RepID=A0ABC9XV88_GRUJA
MDTRSLDIRWIRPRFSKTVHHYRNGEDLYSEQLREYVGRTELVRDGLSSGRLDLRISGLRPSDDGQYVCTVTDGASYGEATVKLEVAATGSVPQLSLEAYEDGGIRVVCRSAGWYPQPEVLWKDPDGEHLPSVSQRHSSDVRGLFDIEDVIVVTDGNRLGNWSCVVRNSRLNQEQETSLHISAPFFHNARPWMVGVGVLLVLSVVFLGLGAYLWRRKVLQSRELALDADVARPELFGDSPRPAAGIRRNLHVSVSFSITKLTSEWWDQATLSVSPWGSYIVLPCHLSPSMEARSLDIRWIRPRFSKTVHHYRNGEDLYREQMEEYVGRTELVRDGLSSGRLDLRISGLRPSDDGQYVCTVTNGASYGEATVDLEVAATGSVPQLSLEAYEDGGIRVVCRSAGWYPQPEVLWKDPDGQRLPSVSQGHFWDSMGLFDIEGVIVVSNGNRHGKWSCVVRNSRLNQQQETSLHISGALSSFDLGFPVQVVFLGLGAYLWRRKVLQSRELDVVTLDPNSAHS